MNRSPRSSSTAPTFGRRRLLRDSSIVVSLGALVAACGEGREGLQDPGRVGVAPPRVTLPDVEVNDVVLLRTAQSLEFTAIEVYAAAAELGVLDAAGMRLVDRFVADHTEHADQVGQLITAAGGTEFRCPNPFYMERIIGPTLDALDGTDDLLRDVLNISYALESVAGATYQLFLREFSDPDLRTAAARIAADETRHAAAVAIAATGAPDGYVDPQLTGGEEAIGADGVELLFAVRSAFGRLGGTPLTVGARDEDGARFNISIQTPADNSYVYDHLSCSA